MTLEFDVERLRAAVKRFQNARILVLGDVMLDRFIWGSVRRISPEAPVPVVEVDSETQMLGGAANVLHNLIALGGKASVCGLVGSDPSGDQVLDLLEGLEVDCRGLVVCEDRQTTVKTRVVAHSQQVVRVDWESRRQCHQDDTVRILAHLEREIPLCDAVIVSDYAKGVVSQPVMSMLLERCRQQNKIICVDPKVSNMDLYLGASIITPNHYEAASAAGVSLDEEGYVQKAGRKLLEEMKAGNVLITQGERGMTLFSKDKETHIPTAAQNVFDVTGAGDTVISTLTLGLAVGLETVEAAFLANLAAGIVVGEVGTSAVSGGRLAQVIEQGVKLTGKA